MLDIACSVAPAYTLPRQWHRLPAPSAPVLSITSYNMLADIYCRPELYTRSPRWALDWHYRRDRLSHQLSNRHSDLFCLQEVEKGEYEQFWQPTMAACRNELCS